MDNFFSWAGRYNRLRYFWTTILITVIGEAIVFGLVYGFRSAFEGFADSGNDAGAARLAVVIACISTVLSLVIAFVSSFPAVKRLHDLGRNGSHYWLLLVPVYNLYLGILLLFKKGTDGPNLYGPDPLKYPAARPGPAQVNASTGRYCTHCGSRNPPGSLFCMECGNKVE